MLNLQSPVIFPSSGRFFHRRSHVKGPTTHYPRDFQFPSLFSQFFSLSSSWELCPQGERRDPAGRHGGEADRLPPSLPLPLSLFSLSPFLSPLPSSTPWRPKAGRRGAAEAARKRRDTGSAGGQGCCNTAGAGGDAWRGGSSSIVTFFDYVICILGSAPGFLGLTSSISG